MLASSLYESRHPVVDFGIRFTFKLSLSTLFMLQNIASVTKIVEFFCCFSVVALSFTLFRFFHRFFR